MSKGQSSRNKIKPATSRRNNVMEVELDDEDNDLDDDQEEFPKRANLKGINWRNASKSTNWMNKI
jgi:hypothetical protein